MTDPYLNVDVDAKTAELQQATDAKVAALEARMAQLTQQRAQGIPDSTNQAGVFRTIGDMGIKAAQGVVDVGQSVVGLGSLATGGLVGKGMRAIGYDPAATNQILGEYLSSSQQASDKAVSDAQGFKDTLLASLQNPRSILGSVTESLPGMVSTMVAPELVAERIAAKAALSTTEGLAAHTAAVQAGKTGAEAVQAALATDAGRTAAKAAIDASEKPLLVAGAASEGAQTTGQIADQAQGAGRDYSDYALPAIAAGVGTGLLNLNAGHIMGSAAVDMAAGTHTLQGNMATKLAKEAFSEGVLEELPQSAQEQVWTNIATGKQWDDGVGNAAASGMVAGAAMGAGFGALHGEHGAHGDHAATNNNDNAAAPVAPVAPAEAVQEAVKNNTPEVFMDPSKPEYNPTAAMDVLFQQNQRPDVSPDERVDNLMKATGLISDMDAQSDALKQQFLTGDAEAKKAALKSAAALNMHMEQSQKILDQMFEEHMKSMEPEDVAATVEQANAPVKDASQPASAVEASHNAADTIINLSMASPNQVTAAQALSLANNTNNLLTDDERTLLRNFSAARLAANEVSTTNKVSDEVMNGSKENLGLTQYRQRIASGITAGNQGYAQKQLTMLGNFADSHAGKLAAITQSLATDGFNKQQIVRVGDQWVVKAPGTLSYNEVRANGGLVLAPSAKDLVENIRKESAAISATHAEMAQAMQVKFGQGAPAGTTGVATQAQQAPVQSSVSTPAAPVAPASPSENAQNEAPSLNISTQENVEDKARLNGKPVQTVAPAPLSLSNSENNSHAGKKFSSIADAYNYLRDNKIRDSHKVKETGRNEYSIVLKDAKTSDWQAKAAAKAAQEAKIAELAKKMEADKAAKEAASPDSSVVRSAAPTSAASVADAPSLQTGSPALTGNSRSYVSKSHAAAVQIGNAVAGLAKFAGTTFRSVNLSEIKALHAAVDSLASKFGAELAKVKIIAMDMPEDATKKGTAATDHNIVAINAKTFANPELLVHTLAHELSHIRDAADGWVSEHMSTLQPGGDVYEQAKAGMATSDKLKAAFNYIFNPKTEFANPKAVQHELYAQLNALAQTNPELFTDNGPLSTAKALIGTSETTGTAESTTGAQDQAAVAESAPVADGQGSADAGEQSTDASTGGQASADAVSAVSEAEHADPLGLEEQRTPEGEDKPYQERNLVADYFDLNPGAESGTQRPLAKIKNFLSALKSGLVSELKFLNLKGEKLTADQQRAIDTFKEAATYYSTKVKENLIKRPDSSYYFKDVTQFLINADGDMAENTKTAIGYGIFRAIADIARDPQINDDKAINAILQRGEDEDVDDATRDLFAKVGQRESMLMNSIGDTIYQALGFKAKDNTPVNVASSLKADLGAYAVKVMLDTGVMTRNTITAEQMAAAMGSDGIAGYTEFKFLSLTRDAEGKLHDDAQRIVDDTKGSKNIVDKLFGVESAMKAPTDKAIPFKQKTTKSGQEVPSKQSELLDKENKAEWYVNQDLWHLLKQTDRDVVLAWMGVKPVDETSVQKVNRIGLQARNDGLTREYQNFMDFISGRSVDAPMFFQNVVWKTQRVGIDNNLVNPQSSKFHRQMLYRSEFEATIETGNPDHIDNLMLRVGEGLGIDPAKMASANAKYQVENLLQEPEMRDAIAALIKVINRETLTPEEISAISTAIAIGKQNAHSLSALTAVARYEDALAKKQDSFTTQLIGEVDGVTNGPMFAHLLLGAASTVGNLFELLTKGGFFHMDDPHTQYNLWRSVAGHFDLYETTSGHMMQHMGDMLKAGVSDKWGNVKMSPQRVQALASALYAFTGDLKNDAKAGRDIIKKPLQSMVFGSSIPNAVDGMADKFIESIYSKIEDLAKMENGIEQEKARQQLLKNLTTLGITSIKDASVSELMEATLSKGEVARLKESFSQVIGEAVSRTMKQDFAQFLEQRTDFNKKAQMSFDLYNAAYKAVKESYFKELVENGGIATRTITQGKRAGEKEPLHSFTPEQLRELDKRMAGLFPVMGTAFSEESKQTNAGLVVANSDRSQSQDPMFSNEVQFAKPFVGPDGEVEKTPKGEPIHRVTTRGVEQQLTAPGVGMLVTGIHSDDAHVSLHAGAEVPSGNNHDARTSGVHRMTDLARALNHATWKSMMAYSPASSIANTLSSVIQGLPKVLDRAGPELKAEILDNLAQIMHIYAEEREISAHAVLDSVLHEARSAALSADEMKFSVLEQMGSLDQYAMEGGAYAVSEADRVAATEAKAGLQAGLSKEEQKALDTLAKELKSRLNPENPSETPAMSDKAKGESKVKSDAKLVDFFKADEQRTIKEVANELATRRLSGFQKHLLRFMMKTLGDKANAFTVRYVTSATTKDQVLAPANEPSHAWFVSKDGKNEIYVLGTEFKDSGLTIETLLHEMVHATVARTIQTATGDAKALVDELEELRAEVIRIAGIRKITGFDSALKDVQEMVAWGMSNRNFQRLLESISMPNVYDVGSENMDRGNPLLSGLKFFVGKLVGLITGRYNLYHEGMASGLSVLLTNTAGLFEASKQAPKEGADINHSMAVQQPLDQLNTADLYEALGQTGINQPSPEFDGKLRAVLSGIVEKIHGAYGSFAAHVTDTLRDPLDVWANAVTTGEAPFAAKVLASGFTFSDQEAFVAEQVEATVRAALSDKTGTTTAAYRELTSLYNEVRENLKDRLDEFNSDPVIAKQLYDFAFNIEAGNGDESNYLAKFAALGLANEEFSKLLDFNTKIESTTAPTGSLFERLHAAFETLLNWIHGKLTHTYEGQIAGDKLSTLVNQLVQIESNKRIKLSQSPSVMMDMLESGFQSASVGIRKGVDKFTQADFFKNSSNGFVRATSKIVSAVAQDRVQQLVQAIQTFRDVHIGERNGVLMGILQEVSGPAVEYFAKLLHVSKFAEGTRKDIQVNVTKVTRESFEGNGKYLTKEDNKALSNVGLRTDMSALLDHFDMAGLHKLVSNRAELAKAIESFKAQLTQFGMDGRAYDNMAKLLAYKLATGKVRSRSTVMNADNIANLYTTDRASKVSADTAKDAAKIIDPLVSLYALQYSKASDKALVAKVMERENARPKGNGVEMLLALHKELQQQSRDRLFSDAGPLQMKGYTPEIYNPYISVIVADADQEGKDLVEQGYSVSETPLKQDRADPDLTSNANLRVYTRRDGGLSRRVTGIISYTGTRMAGTKIHNGNLDLNSTTGQINQDRMDQVQKLASVEARKLFTDNIDPAKDDGKSYMAPVLNSQGEVVNYRYMMEEHTKDSLLERQNDFSKILGTMASSIYDKENTVTQNRTAIEALHEQYAHDFSSHAASYARVGPDSRDPEMREMYRILPESTKQAIRDVWGSDNMMVRYDLMDLTFGYKKMSLTDPFSVPPEERTKAEKLYTEMLEKTFGLFGQGKKAELYVGRFEDVWQALVKEAKDTIVVKSFTELKNNFLGNLTELFWFGVPMKDMVRSHREAFKGVLAYRKDSAELDSLQLRLKVGQVLDKEVAAQRILQLKDALARNPVRGLVEAGMMPTIVEDQSENEDPYSFKSKLGEKVEEYTNKLNPHVVTAAKTLMMAHDTPLYKTMSYLTQVSDFLARYTLYKHLKTQTKVPMTEDKILKTVSDAFVSYDIPSHRTVQYANDMGMVYFTRYYLRIQKVIATLYRQNPGRALMLLTASHYMKFLPVLMKSSALEHFGNPLSAGAFEAVKSLDEMTTINALMYPFR